MYEQLKEEIKYVDDYDILFTANNVDDLLLQR